MYGLRVANRYAKALLEYALLQNALEGVFADMTLIDKTIKMNKRYLDLKRILPLHADNIILYAEISKEPTKKATRIKNYNKVAGYKINKLMYMPTENQQFKN